MAQENLPAQSIKSLLNACLTALTLALAILFVAVLPAEYGIDPTGLGEKAGLLALVNRDGDKHTHDCSPPEPASAQHVPQTKGLAPVADLTPLDTSIPIQWQDTAKIVIPPKTGLEYKFAMTKGAVLEFSWQTDGDLIYYDFHGEPKGAVNDYFKSYLEKMESSSEGALTAPFEGIHGWYWENESSRPIAITLKSRGDYKVLGIMH